MVSSAYRQIRMVNPYGGNTSTNHSWSMGCQSDNPTASDNDFYFEVTRSGTSHIPCYLQDSNSGVELEFTGQHRCVLQGDFTPDDIGKIVSSTGTYYNFDKSTTPKISEAMPVVKLSDTLKDKRVFGVISDKEDESNDRKYQQGNFVSLLTKTDETNRVYINSLGEGSIWVCNEQGNLENGDYIVTSSIPGYGMKQNSEFLCNDTVAKVTQDVNFSSSDVVTLPNGIKAMFTGCTYHCG